MKITTVGYFIFGRKGAGKDEIGKFIQKKFQNDSTYYVYIEKYSGVLKDVVSVLFGWPRHKLDGLTEEDRLWRETSDVFWSHRLKREITPRIMLEEIGTDIMRAHFSDSIWIFAFQKAIYDRVEKIKNTVANSSTHSLTVLFVCTDGRFWNEYKDGPSPQIFDKIYNIHIQTDIRNPLPSDKKKAMFEYLDFIKRNGSEIAVYYQHIINHFTSLMKDTGEHRSNWENVLIEWDIKARGNGIAITNNFNLPDKEKSLKELHKLLDQELFTTKKN